MVRVPNIPIRIATIAACGLAGFVFPLFFFVAAFIAWALVSELREPATPEARPDYYRRFATSDDPNWRTYWLAQSESPAEAAFFNAVVEAFNLVPISGGLPSKPGSECTFKVDYVPCFSFLMFLRPRQNPEGTEPSEEMR